MIKDPEKRHAEATSAARILSKSQGDEYDSVDIWYVSTAQLVEFAEFFTFLPSASFQAASSIDERQPKSHMTEPCCPTSEAVQLLQCAP